MKTACVVLVFLLFVAACPCHAGSETTVPFDEYWRQLEVLQHQIADLVGTPAGVSRAYLLTEAERWDAIGSVLLSDGTEIPVDHSWLVSRLSADPPDLEGLQEALSSLFVLRDRWADPETTSYDASVIDRILERPEFQWEAEERSPLAEWWERVMNRLARLLPGSETASFFRNALTAIGAVALFVALAYALRGLLSGLAAEAELDAASGMDDELLTASTALRRAQDLAKGRDYRTAVRYLYLSSLLLLEERDLLRYDRSLTNREYLRSIREFPQLREILHEVIDVFERVWYGYQPLDERSYAHYEARIEELHRLR
jgi:hypothetical protein